MARRAPWTKEVRVHVHVGVGDSGAVGVEVQILQPDAGTAERPRRWNTAAETSVSPETRGRLSPSTVVVSEAVIVDGVHRSTGRCRLREEIVEPSVVVHGSGWNLAGSRGSSRGGIKGEERRGQD
jgi:hypothetical protein